MMHRGKPMTMRICPSMVCPRCRLTVLLRPVPSRPVPDASAQSTSVTYFTGVVKSDVVTLIRPVPDTVHYRDTMLYHGWSAVPECQRRNPT